MFNKKLMNVDVGIEIIGEKMGGNLLAIEKA